MYEVYFCTIISVISMSFNQRSEEIINNILRGFQVNYPQFKSSKRTAGNFQIHSRVIDVYTKENRLINEYHFYPDTAGNIDSIAIYGTHLQEHLSTISRSRLVFGLPVDDICIDSGFAEFVDIQIAEY